MNTDKIPVERTAQSYVSVEWTRETLETLVNVLHPRILAACKEELGTECAQGYLDAVPHIDTNLIPNLAPMLAPVINSVIEHVVSAYAAQRGERTRVISHDEKGRILETVRLPLWAAFDERQSLGTAIESAAQ